MYNWISPRNWFNILIGIYMGLNVLLATFLIAFPMVVTGPSFILSALQLWLLMISFHILKAIISWFLIKGVKNFIILLFLILSCIWSTWLASPMDWVNLDMKFLLMDYLVLCSFIYVFIIGHRR